MYPTSLDTLSQPLGSPSFLFRISGDKNRLKTLDISHEQWCPDEFIQWHVGYCGREVDCSHDLLFIESYIISKNIERPRLAPVQNRNPWQSDRRISHYTSSSSGEKRPSSIPICTVFQVASAKLESRSKMYFAVTPLYPSILCPLNLNACKK